MYWRRNEGTFFATADRIGTFLFANFAWAALAITIVGIPFATLGLFAVMTMWVQGGQPEFFRVFADALREHWRKALVITAIDVVIGGLLMVNLSIFPLMNMGDVLAALSRGVTIAAALILLMGNVYIWPLVTLFDRPLIQIMRLTGALIFSYPIRSATLAIAAVLPIAVSILLPFAFLLFVTFSLTAYVASYGTWLILQKHFGVEEPEHFVSAHRPSDK